jgi:hypothetical protein
MSVSPGGRAGSLGFPMKNYSIVRIGNEYIVQVNEKSILKVASRRMAAKLVQDAAELLAQVPPRDRRSPVRDLRIVPDLSELP